MSSAIEILKDMLESKETFQQFCVWESTNERLEALKKALLSLEQKEKLVEWLEKEIKTMKDLEKINYTGAFENDLRILKEVLDKVGEQK